MFLKQIFVIAFFLTALNVSAQKYANAEEVDITKDYKTDSFLSTRTFAENITNGTSFTVLAEILKSENLSNFIDRQEMVTIFTPLDPIFLNLSEEHLEAFKLDADLQLQLLKKHMIPGRLDFKSIKKALEKNGGKAELLTLSGDKLIVTSSKKGIFYISDNSGNKAEIVATDFYHKNGFFHIIEGVAAPLKKE